MEEDDDFNFDDLNFDDLSPEEKEEIEREIEENEKHPLYIKGEEVYEIVSAFIESLPEDTPLVYPECPALDTTYADNLLKSASAIDGTLTGIIGMDDWHLCMQHASNIRFHAINIQIAISGLKRYTGIDKDYLKVLETVMEEFRELFKDWVKTFSTLEKGDYTDEWGLFLRD